MKNDHILDLLKEVGRSPKKPFSFLSLYFPAFIPSRSHITITVTMFVIKLTLTRLPFMRTRTDAGKLSFTVHTSTSI